MFREIYLPPSNFFLEGIEMSSCWGGWLNSDPEIAEGVSSQLGLPVTLIGNKKFQNMLSVQERNEFTRITVYASGPNNSKYGSTYTRHLEGKL